MTNSLILRHREHESWRREHEGNSRGHDTRPHGHDGRSHRPHESDRHHQNNTGTLKKLNFIL